MTAVCSAHTTLEENSGAVEIRLVEFARLVKYSLNSTQFMLLDLPLSLCRVFGRGLKKIHFVRNYFFYNLQLLKQSYQGFINSAL